MKHSDENLPMVQRVYRDILDHGILFTRCDCTFHDGGPYSGGSSATLDVLNLEKNCGFQALIWYHFETSVDKHAEDDKYSLTTDSRFDISISGARMDSDAICATAEMLEHWRRGWRIWGARASKCSIGFISGKEMADIPPSHPIILPTLVAAYAQFKAEFSQQVDALVKTSGKKYTDRFTAASLASREHEVVEHSLNSCLSRYSAFVAQAMREQTKQFFGTQWR